VSADRAAAAYRALAEHLLVGDGSQLCHERCPAAPGDNAYSYEWPFSQVHAATLDLTGMPGGAGSGYLADLAARAIGQERYWKAAGGTTGLPGYASYPLPPYGSGGDFFYDDNAWVGLLDVQRYLMRGDPTALARAQQIFALIASGWDSDARHAAPGGVFWTQAAGNNDRNTVSNMPGAQLGLRLHQITGNAEYLAWARRMYDWTNAHLLSDAAMYWDHISLTGNVETTFWSYNQGVPVGAGVLLHQITGDRAQLARAERVAEASIAHFVTGGRLFAQPPYFNAIYFKNLLLLESLIGGHTYRDAMARYADEVWEQHRDANTGLFRFDSGTETEALQQAAMVQIYAVLAWDPGDYRLLY
jgi:hypothetical protein